ncbi:MAG TPA: PilZ domain-containing protein [Phycisphaerales bacterium]|nr:PilZ domain-containing protein [Phycisphaerales bacterium]
MKLNTDRRRFPRFDLEAMYTTIAVRTLEHDTFELHGHSYDISEGGIRFELDRGVERGTQIAMMINLPTMNADAEPTADNAVYVFATVVWIEDEDEPGPIKMAAVFNRWARAGDRERLLAELGKGVYRRQAA